MFIKHIAPLLFLAMPLITCAKVNWVKSEKIEPDKITSARIIFHGDVNAQQVSDLILTLDEINNDYPALKTIKLYISSFGGSMESGYLAYNAVKGSTIPVETINAGITASSATLMYCGAKKRYALPEATFILHPAATANSKKEWLRPNDIELMKKDVEDGNKYFYGIYAECTTLPKTDVATILSSNDQIRFILPAEARKIALSQGETSGIASAQISYFITDEIK